MTALTRAAMLGLGALLVGSCTAQNPHYVGDTGGDGGVLVDDGGITPGVDLAGRDLAGVDSAGVDLAHATDLAGPACVSADARACGPTGSLACMSGAFVPDRTCPNASMCMSGYCAPPPQAQFGAVIGRSCAFNNKPNPGACIAIGTDATCQPFLDPMNPDGPVRWTCDTRVGPGGSGAACTSGAACATGFCASSGMCFMPCDNDAACFMATTGGTNWKCQGVTVVVEGRTLQTKSCVPK